MYMNINRGAQKSHTQEVLLASAELSVMALMIKLMVLLAVATMALASPADFTVVNAIATAPPPPLKIRCFGSGHEDIPYQTLEPQHRVGVGFTPSIWGVTKYACQFEWGDKRQGFNVWYDNFFMAIWTYRPCKHCLWTVTEAGFFRQKAESAPNTGQLIYKWKSLTK